MTAANPPLKVEIDELADSAYIPLPIAKPIRISKELVILGMKGLELPGGANPDSITLSFQLRDFVDGQDIGLPVIILDMSADQDICGMEIPHFSDFHEWLVPRPAIFDKYKN